MRVAIRAEHALNTHGLTCPPPARSKPCGALMQQAADKGLLISVTADSVVRLVPSLVLTAAEAEQIAVILCPLITAFLAA